MTVSRKCSEDIVKYLLEYPNINYNDRDESERTAVMVVESDEIEDIFLSGYGVLGKNNDLDISGYKKVQLIQAAAHGNVGKVRNLLENKGEIKNLRKVFLESTVWSPFRTCFNTMVAQPSNLFFACEV